MNMLTIGYFLLGFLIVGAIILALWVWCALELASRSDDTAEARHKEVWYEGLPLENDGM